MGEKAIALEGICRCEPKTQTKNAPLKTMKYTKIDHDVQTLKVERSRDHMTDEQVKKLPSCNEVFKLLAEEKRGKVDTDSDLPTHKGNERTKRRHCLGMIERRHLTEGAD